MRIVFTPLGQVLGRSDYLPFGETLNQSGALPRQRFTGQERDGEAGLDYFNARSLQARTGRMNRPDPLFGDPLTNPQGWNRYGYVQNNPLGLVDPSGAKPGLPVWWPGAEYPWYFVSGNTPADAFGWRNGEDVADPSIADPVGGDPGGSSDPASPVAPPTPPPAPTDPGPDGDPGPGDKQKERAPLSKENCGSGYWGLTGGLGLLVGRSWSASAANVPFMPRALGRAKVKSSTTTYGPGFALGAAVEGVWVSDWAGHSGAGSEINLSILVIGVTFSFNDTPTGPNWNAFGVSVGPSAADFGITVGRSRTNISCK